MCDWEKDASGNPRARSFKIPFQGTPGKWNAIIDVPGVCVGNYTNLDIEQEIYTGVTSILPTGKAHKTCFCAINSYNGNGEVTGFSWIKESGLLESPIMISNTHSVGIVRDSVLKWMSNQDIPSRAPWGLPVVLETYDGDMNNEKSLHYINEEHVFETLHKASNVGPISLGSIGGGTGNIAYDFKSGCGSASRKVKDYHVGVWCQSNMYVNILDH